MNQELELFLQGEVARRNAANLPAGIGGVPAGAEVHIHYHPAPQVVTPAPDPAQRSTRDDGLLAWFMPYVVAAMFVFIIVGGVVGLIMCLTVVLLGALVTFAQGLAVALVVALLGAGAAVLVTGLGAQKMRAGKGTTDK